MLRSRSARSTQRLASAWRRLWVVGCYPGGAYGGATLTGGAGMGCGWERDSANGSRRNSYHGQPLPREYP